MCSIPASPPRRCCFVGPSVVQAAEAFGGTSRPLLSVRAVGKRGDLSPNTCSKERLHTHSVLSPILHQLGPRGQAMFEDAMGWVRADGVPSSPLASARPSPSRPASVTLQVTSLPNPKKRFGGAPR